MVHLDDVEGVVDDEVGNVLVGVVMVELVMVVQDKCGNLVLMMVAVATCVVPASVGE